MCSTIRPLTVHHYFGWFQRNHVWKAPTSAFHHNLHLRGLLQPVSRSKGPKCAPLSAPSLCTTVLVGFKGTMYGKPQPVPFTRTLNCQDCTNQFRDPRIQSVLDYPPPHSAAPFGEFQRNHVWKAPTTAFHQNLELPGLLQPLSRSKSPKCARLSARVQSVLDYPPPCSAPLFWLVSKEPCMESPNQYLSPEPGIARIAPTSLEIQGSKVCSTVRPLTLHHCFGWFQRNHVWKAPTSAFHQNLHLPGLHQPISRSKDPKCARLSAPSLCSTFWWVSKEPCMESPNECLSPEPGIARIAPTTFEIEESKVCSTIRPPHTAPLFWLVSKEPCMESPNQYLSPEPSFAKIALTSFEIQGSKVCSTIRPLTLHHCFGWFQRNHVWKAPTCTFHQNLELPRLLQPVSRAKSPKCARLSAPSLWATVLVGFKETMYGKPQPVPFTRTLNCSDCSNRFRDARVQSVLDYPPPHSAPLFWLVSKKPCMESPNQYLSPEPSFARIAPTSFEIQGSKVCSTIRPLTLHHCFGWFQRNHVWKAPTCTFHQNLELPRLLQPVSRSKSPKCARLSAPSLCTTTLVGFKETMYGKPQRVPFTTTFICEDCSNQFRDPRVQSVLHYPPPRCAPLFWLVSKEPCMESPNQYLSPEP